MAGQGRKGVGGGEGRRSGRRTWAGVLAAGLATAGLAAAGEPGPGPLHVPSPDWRDQVIYFVMTDRFADGDATNNDQGTGEFDPRDRARYNGGDLRGLAGRLDYIQGLGATTVWVTPPVANRWWDERARYGGFHGYWASDFKAVDAHLGSLDDYRDLSRRLHGRGMYLVQDIVLNHVGNWFEYEGGWNPAEPTAHYVRTRDRQGHAGPTQWPFSLNDPRDPAQRAAGIYHWTPGIDDYRDPRQVFEHQLAGLDDLATENPVVRRALRQSYGHWIREAGVDGFRVDTILYVPPASVDDFLHADDPVAPGIARVARATGREGFISFGEGFAIDKPGEDVEARRIEAYATGAQGPVLSSVINFPLYGSLGDVFARGRPTAELGQRIESMMRVHARPHLMPSFVDNHDVDRFLAGGDAAGLQQALLAILTLPGIPTIYYGTEQGFTVPRAAMFAAGSDSGGRDHYDTGAPLYRYLQRAIALRRGHAVFSRGEPTVLRGNAAGPGGIAWRMRAGADTALVAMNTASHPVLLDGIDTGLAPGARLRGAFAIDGESTDLIVDAQGRVDLVLAPRAGFAWLAGDAAAVPPTSTSTPAPTPTRAPATTPTPSQAPTIASFPAGTVRDDIVVGGLAAGAREVLVVVDGDLAGAKRAAVDRQGRWSATLDTASMIDPSVTHRLVAWDAAHARASAPREFRVEREWTTLAHIEDPAGDDRGPAGTYTTPTDASWNAPTMDLRELRVEGSGGALRLSLKMGALSRSWNPPNGFDHVAFTVFIELPGVPGGLAAMPLQQATLPDGMRWNLRLRAHGWSNALFDSQGASASEEGRSLAPAARIDTDPDTATVRFTLAPSVLGGRRDLSGARIHVSTWDYDGGYRKLEPTAAGGNFGGGAAGDPLVMDASPVVVLP
jgi:glycosidase